jgi:hypothetical protein
MALNEATYPYRVYDVSKVKVYVDNQLIEGLSEDGFGITPEAENTLIKGLAGDIGFNIDPSNAATCVINLKSSSMSHQLLNDIYNKQKAGLKGPVEVKIEVAPDWVLAFGYRKRVISYAFVQKATPFETDGKEAPSIDYTLIGFKYYEESI